MSSQVLTEEDSELTMLILALRQERQRLLGLQTFLNDAISGIDGITSLLARYNDSMNAKISKMKEEAALKVKPGGEKSGKSKGA